MSNDIGLDNDAAEGVAKIIDFIDSTTREHGPVAAADMVLCDVDDAIRAVEHANSYVGFEFVDHVLVEVLALDPDASDWPEVERMVEAIRPLRVAADRTPHLPARDSDGYRDIRDGLNALWAAVRRLITDREQAAVNVPYENDGDLSGE